MNEDLFNLEVRKFLKRFGVTAQREIERAVEEGLRSGKLSGDEALAVRATLSIPGVLEAHHIDGMIRLDGPADDS